MAGQMPAQDVPPGPEDARWMRVALGLARRRLGQVSPNPAVGCVIVTGGRVLGRGATGPGGRPHAETVALAEAEARYGPGAARGATAYVSLEPCDHHGQTPPCSAALIAAGIARVVAPIEDPDPRVSGGGFARLRAAGVDVATGLMAAEARALNAGFLMRLAAGRPFVTLKLATTLDGRIATATGESRWITGALARRRVHLMRAEADGVMIGRGTAEADDPALDLRGLGDGLVPPVRVVADRRLALAPESRLARTARSQPVWLLHGAEAPAAAAQSLGAAGARLIEVPEGPGGLDLAAALQALGTLGLARLMVEGGGQLGAGLLGAGLVDEIALFQAGRVIGADGVPGVGALGLAALADAPGFTLGSVEAVGPDTLTLWQAER